MTRFLRHLKNNAVAYVALFVALGGTSYAAFAVPRNSVGTPQLRNRAVTGRKLARGSVGASNLSSKSIAGYVAFWAQIGPLGQVIGSSPHATVSVPQPGEYLVTWNRRIPLRCTFLTSATNTLGPAYATTCMWADPHRRASPRASIQVDTFNGTGALRAGVG